MTDPHKWKVEIRATHPVSKKKFEMDCVATVYEVDVVCRAMRDIGFGKIFLTWEASEYQSPRRSSQIPSSQEIHAILKERSEELKGQMAGEFEPRDRDHQ